MGATWDEAKNIDPKLLLRLATNPLFTNFKLSEEKKTIEGRQAQRLVARGMSPETRQIASDSDAARWFVQDGDGFFFGTEAEIARQIQRKNSPGSQLREVPQQFARQFDSAGFALVYDDCEQWAERLRSFFVGTKRETELLVVMPFLKGLKRIGVFLDSQSYASAPESFPLIVRIGYQDAATAASSTEGIASLVSMISLPQEDKQVELITRELAKHLQVFCGGDEVIITLHDSKLAEVLCKALLPQKFEGWTDILAEVRATDTPGTVDFECVHGLGTAGFLAQSVRADSYRGKRVRVTAEINCTEDVHSRCGVILWGGDAQHQTTGNATSGTSIGQTLDPQKAFDVLQWRDQNDAEAWRTKSVEWDVPADTSVLSYGIYLAAGRTQVRGVKFEVVGPARSGQTTRQLNSLPRNLMHVPGQIVLDQPGNLDFSQAAESQDSPTAVRSAARSENVNR